MFAICLFAELFVTSGGRLAGVILKDDLAFSSRLQPAAAAAGGGDGEADSGADNGAGAGVGSAGAGAGAGAAAAATPHTPTEGGGSAGGGGGRHRASASSDADESDESALLLRSSLAADDSTGAELTGEAVLTPPGISRAAPTA